MILMVQFATRNRQEQFLKCLQLYVDTLSGKNDVFFNISCDEDDSSMNCEDTMRRIHEIYPQCFINFNNNSTKVEAINANVSERQFDVVINASDDMNPQIHGWDEEIRIGFEKHFPDYDGVLHFNDGVVGELLNTLCILGRPYYDRFGYIYCPQYKSLCCDDEFTAISNMLNKSIYINKIIIRHDHLALVSGATKDATCRRSDRHEKYDKLVWRHRIKQKIFYPRWIYHYDFKGLWND
tara:strand:+ start:48589 stop:49302 length:714 start_codon:yes stop_codon:yes gene_type:complete